MEQQLRERRECPYRFYGHKSYHTHACLRQECQAWKDDDCRLIAGLSQPCNRIVKED